jgi:hypothetical protein
VYPERVHAADDHVRTVQRSFDIADVDGLYAIRKRSLELGVVAPFETALDDVVVQVRAHEPYGVSVV